MWTRGSRFGVAPAVVAELTRLCGADYVQVGSFTGSVYDAPDDVRAQIAACAPAVAVIGGGVSPENARAQVEAAGVTAGVMVLLGSGAYSGGDSPAEAVRATVESLQGST
jgi:ribulose 1,5-bisphosphate carboxylase large subunit-like protein